MKKLFTLLIAISFITVMGAGNALADETVAKNYAPLSVWDEWFDEDGSRLSEQFVELDKEEGTTRTIAAEPMEKGEMSTEVKEFDFIRETQEYDYSKDHDKSS